MGEIEGFDGMRAEKQRREADGVDQGRFLSQTARKEFACPSRAQSLGPNCYRGSLRQAYKSRYSYGRVLRATYDGK